MLGHVTRTFVALAAAAVAALAGCAAPNPADDNRVSVIAAFYPLQFAVEQVAGRQVAVSSLTPPGTEPHDVELTPRQVAAITDADLVVYVKGFQPAVDEAVALEAADRSLDVTAHLQTLGETGNTDPHVWLDPTNMVVIADLIADRLRDLEPGAGPAFDTRADQLGTRLEHLDRAWARGTRSCATRQLVVSHEAFGYLAQRYDFMQVGIAGLSPDTEPSLAAIAAVADQAREFGVTTVYYESLVDPKIAQTVADELGVGTAVLDPIEGVADGSGDTYLTLMRANLAAVRQGQGCT